MTKKEVRILGFDAPWLAVFLLFWSRAIRVMLFDRALTPRCRIKRYFVFFSSRVLSAKTSLSRAEKKKEKKKEARETVRRRQKNRADDGAADRQVVEHI